MDAVYVYVFPWTCTPLYYALAEVTNDGIKFLLFVEAGTETFTTGG